MAFRLYEITASKGSGDTLRSIAEKHDARFMPLALADDDLEACRILASPGDRQKLLDALQTALGADSRGRIIILPVEAVLPQSESEQNGDETETTETREELRNDFLKSASAGSDFYLLVVLSTIVAAVGLLQDNVAVVIGAMVIAPLLGPNLAFAFAVAVGDKDLMKRASKTSLIGVLITLAVSLVLGLLWPYGLESEELLSRTTLNYGGLVLALASGAAAALSISTGVSTTLVGVMVAVALLPPAATFGIMTGTGQFAAALGAASLLLTNVAAVILTAELVFILHGIGPRTWWERKTARVSIKLNLVVLSSFLGLIILFIYLKGKI